MNGAADSNVKNMSLALAVILRKQKQIHFVTNLK